jgi:hypothetical protein
MLLFCSCVVVGVGGGLKRLEKHLFVPFGKTKEGFRPLVYSSPKIFVKVSESSQ